MKTGVFFGKVRNLLAVLVVGILSLGALAVRVLVLGILAVGAAVVGILSLAVLVLHASHLLRMGRCCYSFPEREKYTQQKSVKMLDKFPDFMYLF
jgi:hypothetical protein